MTEQKYQALVFFAYGSAVGLVITLSPFHSYNRDKRTKGQSEQNGQNQES
jgi:hypothetical protein